MLKYPKNVWKAAAEALLPGGEDVSRTDARKGQKTKTAILKALCRTDPAWRAKVREFCQPFLTAENLAYAMAKGWGEKTDQRPKTGTETPNQQIWREVRRLDIEQDGKSSLTEEWIQANPHAPIPDPFTPPPPATLIPEVEQ